MARTYRRDARGRFAGSGGGSASKPKLVGRGRVKQPSRLTFRGTDAEGMAVYGNAKKPKGKKIPANTPQTAAKSKVAKRVSEANALLRRQNEQLKGGMKGVKWR